MSHFTVIYCDVLLQISQPDWARNSQQYINDKCHVTPIPPQTKMLTMYTHTVLSSYLFLLDQYVLIACDHYVWPEITLAKLWSGIICQIPGHKVTVYSVNLSYVA